jgi:glucosamine--fructose-6-phosphate aminotransferase (isomerizing)
VYEIILEKPFREKIAEFYTAFRKKRASNQFPTAIGLDIASDLTLLLKYLSGRLPVSDFDLDFNQKGTAVNMFNIFFSRLADGISAMARPVDAIKHQAKTVTVGTSRIIERIEGILFDTLTADNFAISQLTNTNIIVLKNLQAVIDRIEGSVLYRIDGLSLLGEPADDTTIHVLKKGGDIADVPSRVESDNRLKGTKRIIVRQESSSDRVMFISAKAAGMNAASWSFPFYLLQLTVRTKLSFCCYCMCHLSKMWPSQTRSKRWAASTSM